MGYAKLKNQYRTLERFSQFSDIVPALLRRSRQLAGILLRHGIPGPAPAADQAVRALICRQRWRNCWGCSRSGCTASRRRRTPRAPIGSRPTARGRFFRSSKACRRIRYWAGWSTAAKFHQRQSLSLPERPVGLGAGKPRSQGPGPALAVGGPRRPDVRKRAVPRRRRPRDRHGRRRFSRRAELDMGKLFQSLVGRYEEWAHADAKLCEQLEDGQLLLKPLLQQPDEAVSAAVPGTLVADSRLPDGTGISQRPVLHGPAPDSHDPLPAAQ